MKSAETGTVSRCIRSVCDAAVLFERRWTLAALKRVDGSLAVRFQEQRALWDQAVVTGDLDEVEVQSAAMCRGYAAVVRRLEAANEADDAYLLGQDPRTGFRIAIGHQKAAAERVSELFGNAVVWVTPDEIATVLAGLEGFKQLSVVKQFFPGAEVIDIRPRDPAKGDSGVAA